MPFPNHLRDSLACDRKKSGNADALAEDGVRGFSCTFVLFVMTN